MGPGDAGQVRWWFEFANTATTLLGRPGVGPDEGGSIWWAGRVDHLPDDLVMR